MNVSYGTSPQADQAAQQDFPLAPTLVELMESGTSLAGLIRAKLAPRDFDAFLGQVNAYLAGFEQQATYYGKSPGAIHEAKYAFCALFDETVLSAGGELADRWARAPLQLHHFGEHLAGEGFFQHLDRLRMDPQQNLEVLDVYYECLLLGFKGKYLIEGPELLDLLATRLRQEILTAKGGEAPFSPHARPAQRFNEFIRRDMPVWVYFFAFLLLAILVWLGLKIWLLYQVSQAKSVIG